MAKRRRRIPLGITTLGIAAIGVAVLVARGPAWFAEREESRLRDAIRSIEAELPARETQPAPVDPGADSEPSRYLQMDTWLETNFPPQHEPEGLVDAPWNWGRNHPPILYPYLETMESFFAGVTSTLALPRASFPPGVPRDRVASIRTKAALRWNRLLVAEAWRRWLAAEDLVGAAERTSEALELARRLDAETVAEHAVRVAATTRAAIFVRFLVRREGLEVAVVRDLLEPALRDAATIRFAPALARGVREYARAIEERALDADPVADENAAWARAMRLRSLHAALDGAAGVVALLDEPYPRARPALDAWLAASPDPSPWIERRRLDPRALVRDWEPTLEARTQVALARVALALLEYANEHGAYPDRLEAIHDRFEPGSLPLDPRRDAPFDLERLEEGGVRLVPAPAQDLPPPYRADPPRTWDLPPAAE